MMYSNSSDVPFFWLHIHFIFVTLAFFGFIAALLWLFKHANKKDFLNIVWWTLLIGIFGSLLTASLAMTGWNQMMEFHDDTNLNNDEANQSDENLDMDNIMDEMMDHDEEE